ncbi:MAG: alpha/beta hydrolase [Gemmatimonadota bacterium]|nr:alpha/beta hydrolase [Gemmatimonadota bacterium]
MRRIALPNRVTLSYVDQGRGAGPAIVLLPGLTDSWRSYERVLPHLPDSLRVIAVSLRGHGDSDKPASGYGARDFAGDVTALLDALGIARVVAVGHSSAGLVAQRLAIDHPERTAGLVLESSFCTLRGRADLQEFVATTMLPLQDPIDPAFVARFQEGTIVQPVPRPFLAAMVQESLKMPARVWREAFSILLVEDHASELAAIRAPTLLIWGDGDAIIGRAQQDVLRSALTGSRLVVYAGVGHTPHWEDPGHFANDLLAFVTTPHHRH